jgi:transposase InsO family protein
VGGVARKVFHDPPTERNRVWQTDFSEFETAGGGIWRICAVIDYATKYCLAARHPVIELAGDGHCSATPTTACDPTRPSTNAHPRAAYVAVEHCD